MEGKAIGIIVIIIALVAIGWFFLSAKPAEAPASGQIPEVTATTTTTTTTTTTAATTTTTVPAGVTIFYTAKGFSPKSVTVPVGTTVSFVNQTSGAMWVGSAPHPTHQGYDGTTKDQHCVAGYGGPAPFDECAAGSVFTFTFTKLGTWGYHNHASAGDFGTIVVTAAPAI